MEGGPEQHPPEIFIGEAQMAGVWANFARVSHSEHEFTLDFVRLDFAQDPPQGVVVARVSVSPLFITQLIDALGNNWTRYAEKALPQEARHEPPPSPPDSGDGPKQ